FGVVIAIAAGKKQRLAGFAMFAAPCAGAHGAGLGAPIGGDRTVGSGGLFHGGRRLGAPGPPHNHMMMPRGRRRLPLVPPPPIPWPMSMARARTHLPPTAPSGRQPPLPADPIWLSTLLALGFLALCMVRLTIPS